MTTSISGVRARVSRLLLRGPRSFKLLIALGGAAGAVLAILQLWGYIFGGSGTPSAGSIAIGSHVDKNVTFADFVKVYHQPPPRSYAPATVGDVFVASLRTQGVDQVSIAWTALDGDTSRPIVDPGWSEQIGQAIRVRSDTTGPIYVWVPLPGGVCSYGVRFDLLGDRKPLGGTTMPASGPPYQLSGPAC